MTTKSTSAVPTADWVDPMALPADPYPTYRRLLDESPVAWVPALNQFLVTSYRACRTIEEDQVTLSANVTTGAGTMIRAMGGQPMVGPEIWRQNDGVRQEVDSRLDELLPHYRAHPNETIISAFANSGLSRAQISANVCLVISGGMNEPQHAITSAVWALHHHPDQRERVLADPTLWPTVFDETLRWLSPIGLYPRLTTREVVLQDVQLPAGAPICVIVAAANRDPAEFERADEFDIARLRRPHLAFGSGAHLCAGHWAARIGIGEIAIPLLYSELPGLRADPRRPEAWFGWVFRGLTAFPVTWD